MSEKKFSITLDASRFIAEIEEANKAFDELVRKIEQARNTRLPSPGGDKLSEGAKQAAKEGDKMNEIFMRSRNILAGVFATQQIGSFIRQVVDVRGQFQQLEISFTTMLGSAKEAEKLMSQLTSTAAKTPFDLQGIASSAKQLLAYGFAADQVNDTIVRLGDVAAGLSQPLGDIVYLYGTLRASGRVTTIDIRQFANRGIPVYEELAKILGVAKEKVGELVTAGKVGFPHIEQMFKNLTSEGGKFANLMEAQSKSITGQISNLGDAFDSMLNDIGKSSEGIISGAISSVAFLVENYETVGRVLVGLIATYGVYKAAILTNIALTKTDVLVKSGATLATKAHAAAQALLNKTMLANPYVAVAAGLTALVAAMWAFKAGVSEGREAQDKLNKTIHEGKAALEVEKMEVKELFDELKNAKRGTKEWDEARDAIQSKYGSILSNQRAEVKNLEDIAEAQRLVTDEIIRTAKARGVELAQQTAKDSYVERRGNAQKSVLDNLRESNYTDKEVERIYEKINKAIEEGKYTISNYQASFNDIDLERQIQAIGAWDASQLREAAAKMAQAGKDYQQSLKDINLAWGVNADESKPKNEPAPAPLQTISSSIKEARTNIKKLKQEINDLRSGKIPSKDYAKDIEDREKSIRDLESRLATLTGVSTKGRTTTNAKKSKADSEKELAQDRLQRTRAVEDELQRIELSSTRDTLERIELERKQALIKIGREKADWAKKFAKSEAEANEEFAPTEAATNKRFDQERERAIEEANERFQTLAEQRAKIFSELETAITTSDSSERSTAIKDHFAKQLDEIDKSILKSFDLLRLHEGDGADIVKRRIQDVLPLFERLGDLSIKELRKAQSAVDGLTLPKEAIERMQELGVNVATLIANLEKAKANAGKQIADEISTKLAEGIRSIGSAMSSLGGSLSSLSGTVASIGNTIASLGQSVSAFADIAKSVKEQGAIGAVPSAVSGVSKVLDMIGRQQQENVQRQREWADSIEDSVHKARLMRIEMASISQINIFGVKNPYQGAIDGAKQYLASIKELNDASSSLSSGRVQVGTKKVVSGRNIATGAAGGAAAGAAIGSIIPGVGTLIGGVIGGIFGGISGGLTKKVVPVFESLGKKYGSLFDSETYELNPKVKEDYAKLDDATKKIVDRWDEIQKKALDATQKMRENFKSLAGDLGDKLSESLAKGFRSGDIKGAMSQFRSSVNEIIRSIAEQKLFNAIFGDTFNQLEQRMTDSFKGDNADEDIEDDLTWFFNQADTLSKVYEKKRKELEQRNKEKGIDETSDTRSATTRGIAQASQESIDTMIGQGNTQILQLDKMITIQERMTMAIEGMQFGRLTHLSNLSYLELVAIRQLTEKVESNTAGIKSIGQDIQRNGLKISR